MKKSFMSLIVFFAVNASAQDIIVTKDGSTIMTKVLEIGTNEIKYKKFSNQEGPTYTIASSDVIAINYENGEKESIQVAKEEKKPHIQKIKLDMGTEIPLQNINYVRAAKLNVGESVNFKVNKEIKVNNMTLIPYGTFVKGTVYKAKKSSWWGTKGKLGIRIDNIALADGTNIPVSDGDIYVTGKNRTPLSVCLCLFVTWPACFVTGSKAELPAGYELITKVASPVVFTYKSGELISEISEVKEPEANPVRSYLYDAAITFENGYTFNAQVVSENEKTVSYRKASKPNGKIYQKKKKSITIKKL